MVDNRNFDEDCNFPNTPINHGIVINHENNVAINNGRLSRNGTLSNQNTVSFDHSDFSLGYSNNSSARTSTRNSFLRPKTPTIMGIPTTSSTLTPLLKGVDDSRRRRSSARSMFEPDRRCVVFRQTSSTSYQPPSVASSIMQALSTSINSAAATTTIVVGKPQYRSYPQRWFVLATICLLALSNATQWMSFASLHEAAATFYCYNDYATDFSVANLSVENTAVRDCGVEYWTSQIFQIVGVVTGIFGMYITDRFGIRVSIYCGSILNFAGAVIRVSSSLPQLSPQHRLPLLYFGQTVAATSQPFFLCLSPKVAEYWFSENQRTFANALSFIANPFGVVVGSAVPVIFVSKSPTTSNSREILWLNSAVMGLATIVVLMTLGIRTSRPPTSPSASSECANTPLFFEGLFILFKKPIFYIQMITFGMAFAIQWSFFINSDKMLTKLQYYDKVTGYLLALSALSGSIASVIVGYIVDRSKKFKEVIKLCYFGMSFVAVSLDIFLRHPRNSVWDIWILVLLLMGLGFFSIPVFPVSLELGVETTFPVAEATSSGILCISGQLLMFIITFGMSIFEKSDWFYDLSESTENYQLSIDFWAMSTVLSAIFAYIFLRPRYHRLEYEENAIIFSNLSPS